MLSLKYTKGNSSLSARTCVSMSLSSSTLPPAAPEDPVARAFAAYVQTFFTGDALRHVLFYMCNKCTIEVIDPVTSTLQMFITTPVMFAVTQLGLMPFRGCPMAILPFTHMSVKQKQAILDLLQCMQDNDAGRVSTQLGGGCRVTLVRRFTHTHSLDAVDVLAAFCDAVLSDTGYAHMGARVSVCNIVLQRLGVNVGLSRSTIQDVHARIKARSSTGGSEGVASTLRDHHPPVSGAVVALGRAVKK